MELFELLSTLCQIHGPSGDEQSVAALIETLATPHVDEIHRDTLGNLICHKRGRGPKVMFSAHMDTIGVVATHIDEDGFVHVGALGGVPAGHALYAPVRFHNGVCGLLCADGGTDTDKLKASDLKIDLGASNRAEAEALVKVGDPAVYATPTREAGGRIISPYLDDRIACLILLMAMERVKETDNDLYFVFTVQEEVGTRGAKTAAWAIDPDYGVAVDVTLSDDEPGRKHEGSSKCGKGAAVKVMDRSVICHPQMVSKLMALAEEKGIPAQRDVITLGGTDAGPIHLTRAGVYTGGISVPCRYTHTPTELVDKKDVLACIDLVIAFAEAKLEKEC